MADPFCTNCQRLAAVICPTCHKWHCSVCYFAKEHKQCRPMSVEMMWEMLWARRESVPARCLECGGSTAAHPVVRADKSECIAPVRVWLITSDARCTFGLARCSQKLLDKAMREYIILRDRYLAARRQVDERLDTECGPEPKYGRSVAWSADDFQEYLRKNTEWSDRRQALFLKYCETLPEMPEVGKFLGEYPGIAWLNYQTYEVKEW